MRDARSIFVNITAFFLMLWLTMNKSSNTFRHIKMTEHKEQKTIDKQMSC